MPFKLYLNHQNKIHVVHTPLFPPTALGESDPNRIPSPTLNKQCLLDNQIGSRSDTYNKNMTNASMQMCLPRAKNIYYPEEEKSHYLKASGHEQEELTTQSLIPINVSHLPHSDNYYKESNYHLSSQVEATLF